MRSVADAVVSRGEYHREGESSQFSFIQNSQQKLPCFSFLSFWCQQQINLIDICIDKSLSFCVCVYVCIFISFLAFKIMGYEENLYNIYICSHQQGQEIEHYYITKAPSTPPGVPLLYHCMYSYMYMCVYLHWYDVLISHFYLSFVSA